MTTQMSKTMTGTSARPSLPDFPVVGSPRASHLPLPEGPPAAKEGSSHIYVLASAGFHKLGVTGRHGRDRIRDMQTGNPFPLELVGMFAGDERTEDYLHTKFRHRRVRGEWFDLAEDRRGPPVVATSRSW